MLGAEPGPVTGALVTPATPDPGRLGCAGRHVTRTVRCLRDPRCADCVALVREALGENWPGADAVRWPPPSFRSPARASGPWPLWMCRAGAEAGGCGASVRCGSTPTRWPRFVVSHAFPSLRTASLASADSIGDRALDPCRTAESPTGPFHVERSSALSRPATLRVGPKGELCRQICALARLPRISDVVVKWARRLPAIYIEESEVTQALQYRGAKDHLTDPADHGEDNSLLLVADKPAMVHVYVRALWTPVADVTGTITVQRMKYGVWIDSGTLTQQFPGTITARVDPSYSSERGSRFNSLQFSLPRTGAAWRIRSPHRSRCTSRTVPRRR